MFRIIYEILLLKEITMERFLIRKDKGFTLVELALVLVIVGLLITGVLKGEALIQNARIKKIVNQKDSMTAAYYTFFDKYGQFPGDENLAGPTGDLHNGNANGLIAAAESAPVFEDLALAGIINGSYSGNSNTVDVPTHPFGSWMRIQYVAAQASNCVYYNALPEEVAAEIDRKYDDGVNTSGSIRAQRDYSGTRTGWLNWRL